MKKRARDMQRKRLYRAEQSVRDDVVIGDGSIRDVMAFVKKVLASAVVRRNYPYAPSSVGVLDGRGRRSAGAYSDRITLPTWARSKIVVLHELAHVINGKQRDFQRSFETNEAARIAMEAGTNYWRADFQQRRREIEVEARTDRASHGWQFARILLDLVRWHVGETTARALKDAFRKNNVRFAAKKNLSDAQREAAANRLRAIRARSLPLAADVRSPGPEGLGELWLAWMERNP